MEIVFVRHGLSCANVAAKVQSKLHAMLYRDPELSVTGKQQSREAGRLLSAHLSGMGWDLSRVEIGASSMIRAQQTAHCMFPKAKIRVMPCIAEHGITLDNIPLSKSEQSEALRSLDPRTLAALDGANNARAAGPKTNFNLFVDWLRSTGARGRMVVVTHSHFLEGQFGIFLENNEAILVKYDADMKQIGAARKLDYAPVGFFDKRRKAAKMCPDGCRRRVCWQDTDPQVAEMQRQLLDLWIKVATPGYSREQLMHASTVLRSAFE